MSLGDIALLLAKLDGVDQHPVRCRQHDRLPGSAQLEAKLIRPLGQAGIRNQLPVTVALEKRQRRERIETALGQAIRHRQAEKCDWPWLGIEQLKPIRPVAARGHPFVDP